MKKIYTLLILTLMLPLAGLAQSPAGRLPKTIVADVLAQMPTQNAEDYDQMMRDLISSGAEGLALLMDEMQPAAENDNTAAGFAIGGLSYYVTASGREAAREAVQKALIGGLEKAEDRDVKAFFIRQIEIVGNNSAITVLTKYALTPALSEEALAALTQIESIEAARAIENIFEQIPNKAVAAQAAGRIKLNTKDDVLISWMGSSDPALQRSVLFALSQSGGSQKVMKALEKEAKNVSFEYEPTQAVHSYLTALGRSDDAKRVALLMKHKKPNIRTAAMEIFIAQNGKTAFPAVLKAMRDKDRGLRNAALNAIAPYADEGFNASLAAGLPATNRLKATNEAAADMVRYLGNQRVQNSVNKIILYLAAQDGELRQAAAAALGKIASPMGGEALVNMLASSSHAEQTSDIQGVLVWYPADLNPQLIAALPRAGDRGKIAIMELLAMKHCKNAFQPILAQTLGGGPVAAAAYKALPHVVSENDFDTLCCILESGAHTADMQKAVGAALAAMPIERAVSLITPKLLNPIYYPALGSIPSPQTFALLKQGLDKNDSGAMAAARNWRGFEAAEWLLDNFGQTGSMESLSSYIRMVNNQGFTDVRRYQLLREALEAAKTDQSKNIILQTLGRINVFNSLITIGKYLYNPETAQAAATGVYNLTQRDRNYNYWGPHVKELLEKFMEVRLGGDAEYEKTAVRKYISEAPPVEAGFISAFNGHDLTGWKGLVQNPIARSRMSPAQLAEAQIKADEIMRRDWTVQNGCLVFDGTGYDNLCTQRQYGDVEMYVDWLLDTAGNNADAGIYLRGSPQVQIWDTARVWVGAQVGSGGLYNNRVHEKDPILVADNKLGTWNTFYIKMVGERVTVMLNGKLVVDNVILENFWDRSQPIFPIEQIELQAHGTKVFYRDIYIKELPQVQPYELSAEEQADGFRVLFDGLSMNQWVGNTQDYVAEDGAIALYPGKGSGGNLYTKEEFGDFIFRFEFLLTPGANNGIGVRTPMEGDAAFVGVEIQVLDDDAPIYRNLEPYQYHGSAYGIIPAKRGFLKPVGEWNYQEIEVRGNHYKVTLNGTVILDGDLDEASKNGTIDGMDHPGIHNRKGHLAFLGHGSVVKFRNLRIKEL